MVKTFFTLDESSKEFIRKMVPNFGYDGMGQTVYYLHYSRNNDGVQEAWPDTVIRVIEGTFSIRKDWYVKTNIPWDEYYWQHYAFEMAKSMFRMEWLPPGRGMWAMGTRLVYERGAMPLINCAFTKLEKVTDFCWLMDALMYGAGVGFEPVRDDDLVLTISDSTMDYEIPDSREGWVESLRLLLNAFFHGAPLPNFDYSAIRPKGAIIKTFGGIASGPDPLRKMHEDITHCCYKYINGQIDSLTLKTDIANLCGLCVVTGNVRRSAEICLGVLDDPVFKDLKNYDLYPDRASHGWMSNNSVKLEKASDFEKLDTLIPRIVLNGEPGFINLVNIKEGRLGHDDYLQVDPATGINPCGEQPLESKEVCCLAETLPTRCADVSTWLTACKFATFYASTVALLPTHQPETNAIIFKNRRIGAGIIDFQHWKAELGPAKIIRAMRDGYTAIRECNSELASEAGVRESLRVTTMKPGGTGAKLPGLLSGFSRPTSDYIIRRIGVEIDSPILPVLKKAGYNIEASLTVENMMLVEFPLELSRVVPTQEKTSVWEQAADLILLQREWSDNAVSNTLYFKPKWRLHSVGKKDDSCDHHEYKFDKWHNYKYDVNHEEDQLSAVLAFLAPMVKSMSMCPHAPKEAYPQLPEEPISRERYLELKKNLTPINWEGYNGTDGIDERYCTGDTCSIN